MASMAWTMCRPSVSNRKTDMLCSVPFITHRVVNNLISSKGCMNMHILNATGEGHVNRMAEVQISVCCACHKGQGGPAKQWSGGGSFTCSLIEMHNTT